MPKKFTGENSKAAAARSRKEAVKKEQAEKKKQAEEDAYWRDDDKSVLRKQQRKEEMERKRQEALQRKQENRLAHDEEMNSLAGKVASNAAAKVISSSLIYHLNSKHFPVGIQVTQAHIEAVKRLEEEQRKEEAKERLLKEKKIESEDGELEENVNRLETDGETARSVTEAIQLLSTDGDSVDRHPEKRMKAAYLAFEERLMPRLKEEHPTFRLSQLKQLLKKEWQKSPDNPLNQKILNIVQ
ncbi:unnamed protein product [Anisakis simplex]|uniref:Coiled-coil domain-containing protein 124 n=1 Tax=Anisakis simplex TaxID=6269 RepID=A0A158PNE9_ANISI|nr:unnamed protein product [Anisakis simplex]